MAPAVRRAFHQALDLVLDALAEEQRGTPTKRRRPPPLARPLPPLPPDVTDEDIARVTQKLERAGYRKAG